VPRHTQQPVDGILTVTAHTFLDGGGDLGPFVERSMEYLRFADEDRRDVTVCQGRREISQQVRPVYPKVGNPNQQQTSAGEVNIMKLMMDQQARSLRCAPSSRRRLRSLVRSRRLRRSSAWFRTRLLRSISIRLRRRRLCRRCW
jgi:hypothetical protein